MKKILLAIAFRDFRDPEFFIPKEIFEKNDFLVEVASDQKGVALGNEGGEVAVDFLISEVKPENYQAIIFVGGPGALKHLDNKNSYSLAQNAREKGILLGAICIAPVILAKAGILTGKKATVWTSSLDKKGKEILENYGANYLDQPVVIDGEVVTANGPKAAKDFAEAIVSLLKKR